MLRTRIGARVILGVVLVMTLTLGLMTLAIVPAHRTELIDQLTHNADRLSEAIKNSARDSMLENRRDHLRRQIEAVGRQEGIDRVRIFNQDVEYGLERFRVIHIRYFTYSFVFIILICADQYFETIRPIGISFCVNEIEFKPAILINFFYLFSKLTCF